MNNSKITKIILSVVPASILVSILAAPIAASAQTTTDFGFGAIGNATNLGDAGLITVVTRIINVFLGLLGIIALVLIIYGGYKWMTAGGNEEDVQQAKDILTNATIGLVIIMSSFAIANFILEQFQQATTVNQISTKTGGDLDLNYGSGSQCDPNEKFYVQSITPSTEKGKKSTHMKNVKIRAVFSQPVNKDSLPTSSKNWMTIEKDGLEITGNFKFSMKHNLHVMVAKGKLLEEGNYSVSINKDIKGSNNKAMNAGCGDTQASFNVRENPADNDDEIEIDKTKPKLRNITIGGSAPTNKNPVYFGDRLKLNLTMDDRTSTPKNFGGNSFVQLKLIDTDTGQPIKSSKLQPIYIGPSVSHGSSDPFNFHFETWLRKGKNLFRTSTKYRAEFIAHDIDKNTANTSTHFTVYPSQCKNDDFADDNPGICGAGLGASCNRDADCRGALQCRLGTCSARPIITSISPTSGTKGTWVTIKGKYFGEDRNGTKVEMSTSSKNSNQVSWRKGSVIMPAPQCSTDTWNSSWILAKVPKKKKIQKGEDYAIRINQNPLQDFRSKFSKEYDEGLMYQNKNNYIRWAQDGKGGRMKYSTTSISGLQKVQVKLKAKAKSFEASNIEFLIKDKDGTVHELASYKWGGSGSKDKNIEVNRTVQSANNTSLDKFIIKSKVRNVNGKWYDGARLYYINIKGNGETILNWDAFGATESTIDDFCSNSTSSDKGLNATCETWFRVNNTSRPGLCKVTEKNSGKNTAAPGADLQASGRGFKPGATNVFFSTSSIQGSVSNLSSGQFDTTLPRLKPGAIDIYTRVNGKKSNAVPFRVAATSSLKAPTLESIDPTSTTKGSLVTIYGSNFGPKKTEVWMHSDVSKVQQCFNNNRPKECIRLRSPNLKRCGDTWQDDQIIVKVPKEDYNGDDDNDNNVKGDGDDEDYPAQAYNVAVEDAFGNVTDGQDTLEIVQGKPKPGLCNIQPDSGPAPLVDTAPPLAIYGTNIKPSPTPTLYFWKSGANASNTSTWIARENTKSSNTIVTGSITSKKISTRLPTTTGGKSMQSGPIKLENKGGDLSNSVKYSVRDCRKAAQSTKQSMNNQGYRCCKTGPEAGTWKTKNLLCEGQSRNAGYAWRFATADIPKLPVVEEQCDLQTYRGNKQAATLPSPTPRPPTSSIRTLEQGRDDVCTNANVQVGFNVSMDPETINSSTVEILECGGGGEIDCTNSTSSRKRLDKIFDLTAQQKKNMSEQGKGVKLELKPELTKGKNRLKILKNSNKNPKLKPGSWYRVKLSDDIRSLVVEKKAGRDVTSSYPLQATRPCGDGTAYCFDFRVSPNGNTCNLENAAVDPTQYSTGELGALKGPFGSRLWYEVIGKGNQACSLISVLGYDWGWTQLFAGTGNSADTYVSTTASSSIKRGEVMDHYAKAFVHRNTPATIDITATTSVTTSDPGQPVKKDTVTGTSKLNIDLGVPRATRVFPSRSCIAACPNGRVAAEFNRKIKKDTYIAAKGKKDGNIVVQKCKGELCRNTSKIDMKLYKKFGYTSNEQVTAYPAKKSGGNWIRDKFATGTWYQVTLEGGDDGIKAIGGWKTKKKKRVPIAGRSLVTTTWKFKTKNSMEGCRLNTAKVKPSPYFENTVGDKQAFRVIPRGSPNECNPQGQILNPSAYDWNWKSGDTQVVSTTNFHIADEVKPQCDSNTCLLAGSQITSTSTPTCGNGKVELGEDCDIADKNEVPGKSCNFNCLRPGNTATGTRGTSNVCGNEKIDWQEGEECELIPYSKNNAATSTKKIKYLDKQGNTVTSPPIENAARYCDPATCVNLGSPTKRPADSDAPKCLSGSVTGGEDCDPSTDPQGNDRCSSECLNTGAQLTSEWCSSNSIFKSSTSSLKNSGINQPSQAKNACGNSVSICGNEQLEPSEECEINYRNNKDNELIFRLDKNNTDRVTVSSTGRAVCSRSCKLRDICAKKFKNLSSQNGSGNFKGKVKDDFAIRCNPSDPGCSSDCTLAGSSVRYQKSSVCGNAMAGVGEYPQCEISQKTLNRQAVFGNPVQIATAIGQGDVASITPNVIGQTTTIMATTSKKKVLGTTDTSTLPNTAGGRGGYGLLCGFKAFDEPKSASKVSGVPGSDKVYNNCSVDSNKNRYNYGVANNSCCYLRHKPAEKYPAEEAGFERSDFGQKNPRGLSNNQIINNKGKKVNDNNTKFDGVCRNSQIYAKFNTNIKDASIKENVMIARKSKTGKCNNNEIEVSTTTNKALALKGFAPKNKKPQPKGFWHSMWVKIKNFFTKTIPNVFASKHNKPTWCAKQEMVTAKEVTFFSVLGSNVTSSVKAQLREPMEATSTYAVIMNSGKDGIKDYRDVGIRGDKKKSKLKDSLDVAWKFKTGKEICKIDEVNVTPDSYLYKQPNTSTKFTATPRSDDGQKIQRTSFYNWEYDWGPTVNPAFEVPNSTSSRVRVTSTAEGEMKLKGSAEILEDKSAQGAQPEGKTFSDQSDLDAWFCRNSWPERSKRNWEPYTNKALQEPKDYNINFRYCRDAGDKNTSVDDLPKLNKDPVKKGKLQLFKEDKKGYINTKSQIGLVEVSQNKLFVINGKEITYYSLQDKRNPEKVDSVKYKKVNIIRDLASIGDYLYVFGKKNGGKVEIYKANEKNGLVQKVYTEIEDNKINNNTFSSQTDISFVSKKGGNIYVATNKGGAKINISTSTDPEAVSSFLSGTGVNRIDIQDNLLAANTGNKVTLFDVRNWNKKDSVKTNAGIRDVEITGDALAVLGAKKNIRLFDITNPTKIKPTNEKIKNVFYNESIGSYLIVNTLVNNPREKNRVYDLSDPNNSRLISERKIDKKFSGFINMESFEDYIYLHSGPHIQILNLKDKSNPQVPLPKVRTAILEKQLFLNNENDDAIGLQIFRNPKKKEVRNW
ncbi:MAG: IPT/TIG domain-containing protein, partial [Candidatus Magasanikbacteria bacterium]